MYFVKLNLKLFYFKGGKNILFFWQTFMLFVNFIEYKTLILENNYFPYQ